MGLEGVLKVLNPKKWLSGGDSVTATHDHSSFVVDGEEYDTLEDALAIRPRAQEFDLTRTSRASSSWPPSCG